MTKKYLCLAIFILAFAVGVSSGNVSAQTSDETVSTVLEAEKITAADLGVADPGVLPTNPLYFLKEWRRGIRTFFTFNSVDKAQLELRYANEKAAEAKKVEEESPNNANAINRAVENYNKSQERLRERFKSLQETSENPDVERLLEQLAERSIKHTKLFEELSQKFEGEEQRATKDAADKIAETVVEAIKKDEPLKFAAKLEKVFTEEEGSELKHVRSLEIIDRFYSKAPEEVRSSLEGLRADFSNRLGEDLKVVLGKVGEDKLGETLSAIPGDVGRRSAILEEIRGKAEGRVAEAIRGVNSVLDKVLEDAGNIAERAKEQIAVAEKTIAEASAFISKVGTADSVAQAVRRLITNAEGNLKEARDAFNAGRFGEAFGQARSAEVIARNAMRLVEEKEEPLPENIKKEFAGLEAKIQKYGEILGSRGWTRENQPKAYQLLQDAKTHLGFARDEFAKNNLEGTRLHIGHVIGFLSDLSRIIEGSSKLPVAPTVTSESGTASFLSQCEGVRERMAELEKMLANGQVARELYEAKHTSYKRILLECEKYAAPTPVKFSPEQYACIELYAPVCGTDGKTYSNDCYAKRSGVAIKYRGQCETSRPTVCPPVPAPSEEEMKKCSASGGNYQKKFDERDCVTGYSCVYPVSVPSATDYGTGEFYVTIYEDGRFNPSSITVKRGGKVTWVNKSGRDIWPASAIHPTHQVYPEFDSRRGIKPGESYSFVFEKAGSWKYHNHLNASVTGSVEVVE